MLSEYVLPASAMKALQEVIKGPEVVCANGRELYITYPEGIGRSRLTNRSHRRQAEHSWHRAQLEHRRQAGRAR